MKSRILILLIFIIGFVWYLYTMKKIDHGSQIDKVSEVVITEKDVKNDTVVNLNDESNKSKPINTFTVPPTDNINLTQKADIEIRELLNQFIKEGYLDMEAILPKIKIGLKSSNIKLRMLAAKALDNGIRAGRLKNYLEITNQADFKEIFAGLLNDEYAFMRRVGLRFMVIMSTPDSKSIGLSINAIEKETDEDALRIMIGNFGWLYNISKNEDDKLLIASMLNIQARKMKGAKLSITALMAAKMLAGTKNPPEDILELVVNDIYGNSIPTIGFDVIKMYGKASKKYLEVLYRIQNDLKNGVYRYDNPQDKDYRDLRYINQLVTYIENI